MKKLFAIFFAGIIFFAGCGNENPAELKTEKISPTEAVVTLEHDGKISLSHEVMIYSNVSGKVLERYFKDGDEIAEGQKLFKVGSQETETEILQTKAALGEAMTKLAKATAQKNPVEEIQNEIYELQERVKFLEEESAAGMIHAPIAGQIGIETARLGETINANETILAKIGRTNPAIVRFEISAEEKKFLEANAPKVSLKFSDGTSYTKQGTLHFLNDTTAEATFENPDELLLLGNTVQIKIDGVKIPNALLVPESAIQQSDGEFFVVIVDSDKNAARKKVSVGGKSGNKFIINDGLKAGDSVVIENTTQKSK